MLLQWRFIAIQMLRKCEQKPTEGGRTGVDGKRGGGAFEAETRNPFVSAVLARCRIYGTRKWYAIAKNRRAHDE